MSDAGIAWAILALAFLVSLACCLSLARAAARPRPHLPGSLARDPRGFDAELEAQRGEGEGRL